ncbi:hypothetical protein EW026_g7782 [Hermanssonia centrifuga]|uniref:Uncharacterized protein n=1 Tax=Hermanssonia centrifuga TaxID=98765 RepID=A0A4S4K6N8_9APHY|nr:hypothetical protein EW026_g7782 [Hermanssonia centrifuga]
MATRQSLPRAKANTRPAEKAGLLPTKRRTSEQVRADKEEKEQLKNADLAAKAAANSAKINCIAELEDRMAVDDANEQLMQYVAPPPAPPRPRPRPRLRTGPQLTRTFAVSDLNTGANGGKRQPEPTGVTVTHLDRAQEGLVASEALAPVGDAGYISGSEADLESVSAADEVVQSPPKKKQKASIRGAVSAIRQDLQSIKNNKVGAAVTKAVTNEGDYNGFGKDEDEIVERIAALASPSKAGVRLTSNGVVGLVQPKEGAQAQPVFRKSKLTVEAISESDEVQIVGQSTAKTKAPAKTKATANLNTATGAAIGTTTTASTITTSAVNNHTNADLPAGVLGQKDPWNIDDPKAEAAIKETFTVIYPNIPYPHDSDAQHDIFGVLNQRVYEYRSGFGSTAIMALHDYLGALPQLNTPELQKQHLLDMLERRAFLYKKFDLEADCVTPYWGGLLRSPFIIQTFAHHFTFTEGAKDVPMLAELEPKGALAMSAAAMERAFTLWAEGMIGFNKRGLLVVLPARNARTGKESKTLNAFAEQNWGEAIRWYVRSVGNMKPGSFTKIVDQAKAFAIQTRLASKRHVPVVLNSEQDDEIDDRGRLQDLTSDED